MYDQGSGILIYDTNGRMAPKRHAPSPPRRRRSDGGNLIAFAVIDTRIALTAADCFVI